MKKLVLLLSISLTFVGVTFAAVLSTSTLENSKSEFANFEEMKAAGLITRGWLPAYFPKSATEILEGHNLDTNHVWASFKYETKDIRSIAQVCQKIVDSDLGSKLLCPPHASSTSIIILRNDGKGYYLRYQNPLILSSTARPVCQN